MEVKINLNNPPATEEINVELQWNVEVTAPKPGLMARLFRKHNRINRSLKLSISDIKVPEDIVCDPNNLFAILYDGEKTMQRDFPVTVNQSDMKVPFQLLFRQVEIKDCKKPQDANPRSYPIKFKVVLQDMDDNIVDTVDERIDVIFQPLGVKPNFSIYLEQDELQYSSALKSEKIGYLASWLNESFRFTPDQLARCTIKLYKGAREIPGIISFGDNKNVKDLRISRGRRNVIKTPIYVDFTTISNPLDKEEDYTVEASIVLSAAYSPEVRETILKQAHFKLLKDLQGTELKIYVQMAENAPVLCESERSFPAIPMRFVPHSRLMGQAKVILSNIATDNSNPRAGLYVKNLTLTESIIGDVKIIGDNNAILDHFVNIDGPGVEAMNSFDGLFIPNGANARTTINISLNPSGITDLINSRNYDFQVQSVLTFDYWEDKDGLGELTEETKKEGKIPIIWKLHLEPNPEWLCVDYGSSAIVCRYDKEIIDLKKRKDSIFRKAEDGKYKLDNIESNTRFLSSDIVFYRVREPKESTLCSQQPQDADTPYLNLSVCLSPTSSLLKNFPATQLPCLKILVGNEYLPDKYDYLSFQYSRRDDEGRLGSIEAKKAKERGETSCILRISSIFNEAYAALFRYFILPESLDKSINKLVLTYPNTYTPSHLKVMEKIARSNFPKVRDGYLRFVSESDAVAAYYLNHWDSFNPGRNINDDETVLVYDMGAGTLDLTLIKKTRTKANRLEVSILGKIGTGKAGNYLDYLIGEIISDKVPGAIRGLRTVSTGAAPDVQTMNERVELKEIIKNSIKPNLKPNTKLKCGPVEFDSSVILEDTRFTDFLEDVTSDIICKLLDTTPDPEMTIDTVIMSGRSCRLPALQKSLKDALYRSGNTQTRIIKFASGGDKEKTVVVEGAMARASIFSSADSPVIIKSKRLYASYGLMYPKLGGTWRYTELLNSAKLPFVSDNSVMDDYEGPNVTAEGTASASTIKLIQTYLSPEDTERAYNDGNLEFISVMEEYDMADFGGRDSLNVKLKLDYKNNISLYVNGKISIGSSPKGIDLSSEITKRSIWPVTI